MLHGYYSPFIFNSQKQSLFEDVLRLDVLVNDLVICELEAIETVNPVWEAQLLSHLKLTDIGLGYLINFNFPLIGNGIKRMAVILFVRFSVLVSLWHFFSNISNN